MTLQEQNLQVQDTLSLFKDGESNLANEQHGKLLNMLVRMKQEGDSAISDKVGAMREADKMYSLYCKPDDEDKKAAEKGQPVKIIIPTIYAQIQTALAILMSFSDRKPFFPLAGRRPDYHLNSKLMELELDYQLNYNNWTTLQYQWQFDALKYGFGKMNIEFVKEKDIVKKKVPAGGSLGAMAQMMGLPIPMTEVDEEIVTYEGAKLVIDDPYNIKWDPEVTFGNIQQGRFVLYQKDVTYNDILSMADTYGYFNLQAIPKIKGPNDSLLGQRDTRNASKESISATLAGETVKGGEKVHLDIFSVKLIPADYQLSDSRNQQIWVFTVANESRIIGAMQQQFGHGKFPCAILEYNPDVHEHVNSGMTETIVGLGKLIDWLINSHITNVRKVINNTVIVDETGVNIEDLKEGKNVIRLKREASRQDVRKFIQQLPIADVTQQHIADASYIFNILQRTTGISDNLMGIQTPTKRTATEIQGLQKMGGNRMNLLATMFYEQGFRPMAQQMIKNTQDFMSVNKFLRLTMATAVQYGLDPARLQNQFLEISKEDIMGSFDIEINGVNSVAEEAMAAEKLEEFMGMLVKNPTLIPAFGVNLPMLVTQILANAKVKGINDIVKPPTPVMSEMINAALMKSLAMGGAPVKGELASPEDVGREVDKGNLIPMNPVVGNNGQRTANKFP